jgi:PiT family inorganic phosphate transporter
MGLLMLILVGIVPATFALNLDADAKSLNSLLATAHTITLSLDKHSSGATLTPKQAADELSGFLKTTGKQTPNTFPALTTVNNEIVDRLTGKSSLNVLSKEERSTLRSDIYLVSETISKLDKKHQFTDATEDKAVLDYKKSLDKLTKFIPVWVKVMVALALGLGTMIGWKRIVVTVGEKIGKDHLTYAQGASAELVAMGTILAADHYNLPVSTTHVLSSGVAGTMAANHSGLQMGTLRNLLLAWVLTLPVCVFLGAATFSAGFYIVFHILGLK